MSWIGFNTAVSGLFGSQKKLYTVNHNIANASKEGYSRQQVNDSANRPHYIPGIGYIGAGISVDSVERIRDTYLDRKYRAENGNYGEWEVKARMLTEVENVLRGSQEEGINVNLDEFFKAIEDLSTNPSDLSYRAALREKANSFAKVMNETVNRLYKQQKDINFEVKAKIKEVNEYAEQIKNLNDQIFRMEVDGSMANDLRDQRDAIIDKLSKIVDIEVKEEIVNLEESKQKGKIEVKQLEVRIGGMLLVSHNKANKLKYPPEVIENELNPEEPLYKVEWASGGEVKLKGGELKGLLEVRDGGDKLDSYNGIPYYIDKLDEFAKIFAQKINEIHNEGYNLNGDKGINFFTANGESDFDIDKIRADNISISKEILEDLKNIATIDSEDKTDIENNGILRKLSDVRESTTFFDATSTYQGKPEDFITSLMSTLGTDAQQGSRMLKNQKSILNSVETHRDSVSGVDINEETSNMIRFQQLYNASARMVTTFDQIYETTINRLGMVGR